MCSLKFQVNKSQRGKNLNDHKENRKAAQLSGFNLRFLPFAALQKHHFLITLYIWCQDINVPSALYKKILFANNYLLRLRRLKADSFHFALFCFQLRPRTEHLPLGGCFYLKWPKYHRALLFCLRTLALNH